MAWIWEAFDYKTVVRDYYPTAQAGVETKQWMAETPGNVVGAFSEPYQETVHGLQDWTKEMAFYGIIALLLYKEIK